MIARLAASVLSAAAVISLVSCASTQDAITKVNSYKLDAEKNMISADPAIPFEQKHRLYGAVSAEDIMEREGHYYTVRWRVADPSQPVKLRLQYRHAKTGSKVHTKEIDVSPESGENVTEFQVTGKEYQELGHVIGWNVSLLRGKSELASHHSYLWK